MRILIFIFIAILSGCAGTSVVMPVGGSIGIKIESNNENTDCKPVIVNGKKRSECLD